MRNKNLKDGAHSMSTQSLEIFTTTQVAEMFSVNPVTVDRWRKSGRLKGLKLSPSQVRFTRDAIQQFIRSNQQPKAAPAPAAQ